jgi:hypothetical protein
VNEKGQVKGMSWQTYALMTVLFWGVYGVLLHMGRGFMPGVTPPSPEGANAGLKAFLMVCGAYAITGVIAIAVLKARGSAFTFTSTSISWSLVAGLAGALGAFTLVLALGAAATPLKLGGGGLGAAAAGAVMPIVFGGAPIVNAIVSMLKQGSSFKSLPLPFILGILLAASGGFLVAKFAPTNTGAPTNATPGAPPAH